MGNFAMAVFIRNERKMTGEEFTEEICKSMEKRGYKRATGKSGSCWELVFSGDSDWVALKRKAYESDREVFMEDAGWFSEHLQTSCISIELVDSDFADLGLYGRKGQQMDSAVLGDASGYFGEMEMPRGARECWEPLLKEGYTWDRFQEALAGSYTFAEEGLDRLGPLLGLDAGSLYTGGHETVSLYFRKAARTPSFDAAFKKLYAEKLAPYGFKKIKGRRPYIVRMVGDEIIHAVSYADAGTSFRPYKDFNVVWGVATVYRPRINMDGNPRYESWMKNYVWDASGHAVFQYRDDSTLKPGLPYSTAGNDVDMMEELERSVEAVIQETLPRLDQVKTLEDCKEILGSDAASVRDYDLGREYDSDEGMLNYKLYTLEEFEERRRKSVEMIESRYKEEHAQLMKEQVAIFRKYTEDERYHKKVLEEMTRRKAANQEILRGYGLEF